MNSIRSYYHNDADYHTTASEQPLQTAMGSGKAARAKQNYRDDANYYHDYAQMMLTTTMIMLR